MYKSPELSKMAKMLRAELAKKGLALSHAQALEVLAKTTGHRTLHVAQAKETPAIGIDLEAFAQQEAATQMFTSLGRFEGNCAVLMDAIRDAFESPSSREIEHAVWRLLEEGEHPVLDPNIQELYRVDQLPALFAAKVTEIKRLAFSFSQGAVSKPKGEEVLFQGPMRDWMAGEGQADSLTDNQKRVFQTCLKKQNSQIYVDISQPCANPDELDGTDQMGLIIEVNRGVPCVHITNSIFGDQVLTVFATKEGLYLRPGSSTTVMTEKLSKEGTLRELAEEDRLPGATGHNDAFIEVSNAH